MATVAIHISPPPYFAVIAGPRSVLATKRPLRHMLRSMVGVSAMAMLFFAFSKLNMTETVALNFTVPFFVTIGAVLFLGETIRMRRIAATVVGFLGVLVVAGVRAAVLLLCATQNFFWAEKRSAASRKVSACTRKIFTHFLNGVFCTTVKR